jgi:hypothetical protein
MKPLSECAMPPAIPPPASDNQLLRHIADKLDELVQRTAKVEKELLGEEGSREGGLVFRLALYETRLANLEGVVSGYKKFAWTCGSVVVGLVLTWFFSLMTGRLS